MWTNTVIVLFFSIVLLLACSAGTQNNIEAKTLKIKIDSLTSKLILLERKYDSLKTVMPF